MWWSRSQTGLARDSKVVVKSVNRDDVKKARCQPAASSQQGQSADRTLGEHRKERQLCLCE